MKVRGRTLLNIPTRQFGETVTKILQGECDYEPITWLGRNPKPNRISFKTEIEELIERKRKRVGVQTNLTWAEYLQRIEVGSE